MNDTLRLYIGLFGAPVAWLAQTSLSEPLAAEACYPHQRPLSAPAWEGLMAQLTTIGLVCLAAGFLSGLVAWGSWQRVQREQSSQAHKGRIRFLALLGVMSSFIFIVALLLSTCASLLVSPCHP